MSERQATALARLHAVRTSLGALYPLLEMCVVDEMPWKDIGRRLRIAPSTARVWCLAATSALAAL